MTKERPILMSGPLVLATLAGRKTVTRRISEAWAKAKPGELLWIKETWAAPAEFDGFKPRDIPEGTPIWYAADGEKPDWAGRLRPSIFMRRWMSRLSLRIEDVRRERLLAITEEDARAEGVEPFVFPETWSCMDKKGRSFDVFVEPVNREDLAAVVYRPAAVFSTAREKFRQLWCSINGPESWEENPFVRRIAFRRIYP